jgi:hypothetical protein
MQINWGRFVAGAIVASLIAFLTDGFLHEKLVLADWQAVYTALGAREPTEHGASMLYFAIFELGRGFIAMLLYVLMRPTCKPGPKTAAWAGLIIWIAFSLTGPAQFIPLGFYSIALWIKVGAFQLVTSIVAAVVAAALYKDAVTPASA